MGISVIGGSSSAGTTRKVARFTTEGVNTFTLPSGYDATNPLYAEVTLVGAGGGAGCGFWTSTTNLGAAGGGGGGAVKKLNLALTSNLTAHVGYRGYGGKGGKTMTIAAANNSWHGGNGGATFLGNGTPKNLFINPQCLATDISYTTYILSSLIPSNAWAPAVSGNVIYSGSYNSGTYYKSQPYSVKPSTQYSFSHYAKGDANGSTCRAQIEWYNSSGTYISTSAGSFTSLSSSAWTRYSTGDTSPATAAYAILVHNRGASGSSSIYISNLMLEEGTTTASTYCDGATAGYAWSGHPAGSVTISTSDIMYVANGGGGGGGYGDYADGSTTFSMYSLGFPGATSGGGAAHAGSASTYVWGGHGGGAGTNATPHQESYYSYSVTTNSHRLDSLDNYMNKLAEYGSGTHGQGYQGGAWSSMTKDTGKPGDGLSGFGKGGYGSIIYGTPQGIEARDLTTAKLTFDAKLNSGDGGSSGFYNVSGDPYRTYGGNGGSGYIEIVYWA